METKARASTRFSAELIRQLVRTGLSQSDIARALRVSRSFISRAAAGQRALTIDHLAALEQTTGRSTALTLLEGLPQPAGGAQQAERLRLQQLLSRKSATMSDQALSPHEQREVSEFSAGLDDQLKKLVQTCSPRRLVGRARLVRLLTDRAGLSPATARRVYDVQAAFAQSQGFEMFTLSHRQAGMARPSRRPRRVA